ncbi:MAG: HTH domain-containing protein [Clostridia bacterium]|nr:HTH domain-containing protein [Clostridia bacterium]
MKNTSERRQMILEYLLEHRETTRFELSNHFNVSLRTIERDILILSCSYPIITIQGGGGGIKIADGYRLGMKYLSESQAALLEQLSETLSGKDLEIMQSILKIFSKPASCK